MLDYTLRTTAAYCRCNFSRKLSFDSFGLSREPLNKPPPPGEPLCPCPRVRGQVRNRPNAPGEQTPTAPFPKQGAGGAAPAGGTGGVPLFPKTLEGGPGGTTAHAKPIPPLKEGASRNKTIRSRGSPTPIAKYERLCYSTPMKSATGPLLFLGACRITYVLGANHGESPCGRGAEGTTQGARPSEEGWDRSQCRYKAQALWSHPAPLRFRYGSLRSHYGSFTVPLRFLYGSLRPITPLLRRRAYTPEIRLRKGAHTIKDHTCPVHGVAQPG